MSVKHIKAIKDGADPIETLEEFEALTKSTEEEQGGRKYTSKSLEKRLAELRESRHLRAEARKNAITFLHPDFLHDFYLQRGLILFGAKTGSGKSTVASNMLAGFVKHSPDKKVIIITNEESTSAIVDRTACILCGLNYVEYSKGRLDPEERQMVIDTGEQLIEYVEVVGGSNDSFWDMTVLEDVKAVLEHAVEDGQVGLVIIDYLQTITTSRKDPKTEQFLVSKKLGYYLKAYGMKHAVPVVILAQLNDSGGTFKERIEYDKTIANHSFICIEAKTDFDAKTTTFYIVKDRDQGKTNKEVVMQFKGGMLVPDVCGL